MSEEFLRPFIVSEDTRYPSGKMMPVIGKSFSGNNKFDMCLVPGFSFWGKAYIKKGSEVDFSGFRVEQIEDEAAILVGPQMDVESQIYAHKLFGAFQNDNARNQELWPVCKISESGIFSYGNENFGLVVSNDGDYEIYSSIPNINDQELRTFINGRRLLVAFDAHVKDIFPKSNFDAQVTTGLSIVIGDYMGDLFKKISDTTLTERDIRKFINPFMAIKGKRELVHA